MVCMRGLRALCAALLFLAFTLGMPLHGATAHGMAPAGTATLHAAHAHDPGKGKCCPDHHAKAGPGALCQLACGAAVAVLDGPALHLGTRLAYLVRFAAGPSASGLGATPAPDPFPPRPSRIA